MPYPPPVPPATRTDATVMATNHPADHNTISAALTEILNHIATMEQALYPIGVITEWGGDLPPGNHELCRGQAVLRSSYPEVFAIVGTKFGSGDGSTTFNLPNYQGRAPVGVWPGGPYGAAVGAAFGNANSSLASHQHRAPDHFHQIGTLAVTAQHNHGPVAGPGFVMYAPGGSGQYLAFSGPGGMEFATPGATDHANLSLSGFPGVADRPLDTDFRGVDPTNTNLPPSLTVNFVMRMH